jgi:hypothetical protein
LVGLGQDIRINELSERAVGTCVSTATGSDGHRRGTGSGVGACSAAVTTAAAATVLTVAVTTTTTAVVVVVVVGIGIGVTTRPRTPQTGRHHAQPLHAPRRHALQRCHNRGRNGCSARAAAAAAVRTRNG